MELCLLVAPEAVELFMPLMSRMDKCFGRCPLRTAIPARRRLWEETFTFLTRARSHMLLTPQPVSNCGTTIAAAQEAVARHPSYMVGKCTSVTIFVTRQLVWCWMPKPEIRSEVSTRIHHQLSLATLLCTSRAGLLLESIYRADSNCGALQEKAI
jgi:hypothetical protein